MNINFPLMLTILVFISGIFLLVSKLNNDKKPQIFIRFSTYLGSFFPVLLFVFVLRSFIFEPFQIPSGSMIPTLKIGDYILVNKFSYGLRFPVTRFKFFDLGYPERGDVMVFTPPHDKRYFIKRVLGLPGDKIMIKNNILYLNGSQVDYTFLSEDTKNKGYIIENEILDGVKHLVRKRKIPTSLGENYSIVVPPKHYFMVGDNRDNSSDSRMWGAVPEANIVGKAILIWMSWSSFSELPSFSGAGKIR
jgi:signal peptidase I